MDNISQAYAHHPYYVKYSYFFIKNIFGPIVRLIWIRKVNGLHNLPIRGAAVVAFNHQSYFDFICFIAICPRQIHFLSAEKFFSHFFWKHLMKFTGQIKVNRHDHDKSDLHATVYDHLRNGLLIGIFPEGTRSGYKDQMLRAFTGVAKYAISGKVPVIPVGIQGSFEVMSRHNSLPKLYKNIIFNIGSPIHFTEHHDKIILEEDYRKATNKVMREISLLSGKHYQHFE